jgi:uncharacterized protein (TIGR02598 family)
MRASLSENRGFSLVEVVLALGVASIALVTIIGLLGVAVNTSGSAGHDTLLVAMTNEVLNDLRAAEFDGLWKALPRAEKKPTPAATSVAWADSTYYFSNEGALVDAAKAADFATMYQCVVKKTPDPTSQLTPTSPYNLVKLQLTFTWPVSANSDPAKRPNRQTIYASIARY